MMLKDKVTTYKYHTYQYIYCLLTTCQASSQIECENTSQYDKLCIFTGQLYH